MWDKNRSIGYVNSHAEPRSLGKCAGYVRRATEAGGVHIRIPPPRIGNSASACDYGPSFVEVGFKVVYTYSGNGSVDTAIIPGQQAGDVVVIQPIDGHPHGHIAIFNGTNWVSDFVQLRGFYPGQLYRNTKPAFVMYRYGATEQTATQPENSQPGKIKICYPIKKQNGQEFVPVEDILAHLDGEPTGTYMLGRNGMWHGGIHITNTTTPWCALSGKAASEAVDFPVPYKGEQAVRCMADGEVVAYRICRDYVDAPWETGPMKLSGSFVLVKHYVQPGEKKESGLHFYTLYMHLAPWSAYSASDGKKQWTVNDSLSAYKPEWLLSAGADSKSVNDSYRVATMPKGSRVEWDDADTSLRTTSAGRSYGLVTFLGLSPEDTKSKTKLQPGQQYWILVDKKNVIPVKGEATRPAWWTQLLPPFTQTMLFDSVACPTPYAIKAGDAVGHLGYFQAPKEGGYESRYQVHIECLSMDDNLEAFLKNPEKVGQATPLWLKCPAGLPLYEKNVKTGAFTNEGRTSDGEAILKLSQVKTEQDAKKKAFYYLPFAHGYVPTDGKGVEKLSQYDFEKLGFKTIIDEATTFDHLDGKTPPDGLVKNIFETLLAAAKADPRMSHSSVPFNYQRLLNKIESRETPYSPQEYLSAVQNPSYRDARSKLIVKHPSEWYYKKGDTIWQPFLKNLTKDAPEWKTYSEGYIDKMVWMQEAAKEKLGPMICHMHPVMFLGALLKSKTGWAHSKFADFLGNVESKNDYTAYNVHVTYTPHYKTNLTAMTLQQVRDCQDDASSNGLFATGRFQITPDALKAAIKSLGLNTNDLYNEAMQDRIFEGYLIKVKRPAIINYLEGNGSVEDAIYDWAKEFASAGVRKGKEISRSKTEFEKNDDGSFKRDKNNKKIGVRRYAQSEGVSYYSGDGINKAHIKPDDMVRVLEESKNESS
ncbi:MULTISPECIES: hypothetical protein [unclassified Enterobacter]|uniref:hypothetical protein n=1 Tax=unclassified Enterobacter TaxID=2608935 RepID=UPI00193A2356|nr:MULTISPECIES: hypothetical protein [unclassified Enterobacter]MBM1021652.1 hypothetical protein [Enterobacter sp. E1]MEA3563153.1 hypothetical protein [Enterobacter sp. GM-22]MEA3596561.1 hypothetical protein [Enterobacter sp. GM-31]